MTSTKNAHVESVAPAAVLLTGALGADTYPSLLINPSIATLPDLLTTAGLLCYGLSAQRRYLLMSAFALGAGISVHIGAMSLAVPLLTLAALAQQRPWRDMAAAVAIVVATYGVTSSAAGGSIFQRWVGQFSSVGNTAPERFAVWGRERGRHQPLHQTGTAWLCLFCGGTSRALDP